MNELFIFIAVILLLVGATFDGYAMVALSNLSYFAAIACMVFAFYDYITVLVS